MQKRSSCLTVSGGLGAVAVAVPVMLAVMWWAIFGAGESRAPRASPTATATVAPTATATPLHPITGPSAEELRTRWDDLTKAQQTTYRKELVGAYVRWQGKVVQVHADGTVNLLAVFGTKALASVFLLPLEEAELLNLDQEITIEGTILLVEAPEGEGGLLDRLVQGMTLLVYLENVTVLP